MNKSNELNNKFHELYEKYEVQFGEGLAMYQVSSEDAANIIEVLSRCIETNTPYKYPELPEGCIA